MVNAVQTIDLVKEFDGLTAVSGINLSIDKGEVFGLLGPNGAGKTTTIKMLITLLKPTSGKATVAGLDVVSQQDEVRRKIGYVPQESALDIRLTATENLQLFAELYSLQKRDIKQRIRDVLELVELDKRKDDLVAHFSGGMKRRLEIARGLLPTPEVLFLDEPTLGLDPQTRRIVWEFVHRLQREWNLTILATTHYLEEAEQQMDRVAIIDKGHIMAMGKPADLKSDYGKDLVEVIIKAEGSGVGLDEQVRSKLLGLELGNELSIVDRSFRVAVADGKRALPIILHKIESSGIGVDAISVRTPSLDDVFIKYTGRGIREEGEVGEDSADTRRLTAKVIGKMRQRV
ncbi:MAG: ATP-binding cassette domain-containing protein [Promethearchaeati archaeon SRVP18_Atabeyarchaeia-1]